MKSVAIATNTGSAMNLQSLYLSSKNWLSYIDFFEDELKFFKKIIQRQHAQDYTEQMQASVVTIEKEIKKLESLKNLVLNNIFCYQSNLRATMEGMMQLSEEYLMGQHQKIQDEVKQLQPAIDTLKNKLYILSETNIPKTR